MASNRRNRSDGYEWSEIWKALPIDVGPLALARIATWSPAIRDAKVAEASDHEFWAVVDRAVEILEALPPEWDSSSPQDFKRAGKDPTEWMALKNLEVNYERLRLSEDPRESAGAAVSLTLALAELHIRWSETAVARALRSEAVEAQKKGGAARARAHSLKDGPRDASIRKVFREIVSTGEFGKSLGAAQAVKEALDLELSPDRIYRIARRPVSKG